MKKRKAILIELITLGIILSSFIMASCSSTADTDKLSVYFFNAGKADACVISDGEHTVMIDTGESTLAADILSYFTQNKITKLDCLIITHFDKDHVGSASAVIENIDVDTVFQSNSPKESEYYTAYLNALESKSITPVTVSGDYDFTLGDMVFSINGPETVYEKNESNNSSLITSLFYGDTSFIFMGDAQNDRLKDFIAQNSTTYDFVKIPYHGNFQKQLENLLENITPTYAVITSSEEEIEEEDMTNLLDEMGIKYYLTRAGDITVTSDKTKITVTQ